MMFAIVNLQVHLINKSFWSKDFNLKPSLKPKQRRILVKHQFSSCFWIFLIPFQFTSMKLHFAKLRQVKNTLLGWMESFKFLTIMKHCSSLNNDVWHERRFKTKKLSSSSFFIQKLEVCYKLWSNPYYVGYGPNQPFCSSLEELQIQPQRQSLWIMCQS